MKRSAESTHCRWCSGYSCRNSRNKRPDLAFFGFPSDPETSRKWVANTGRSDLEEKSVHQLHKNNVLCELHFEPVCFRKSKRKLLIKNAIPTLFDFTPAKKVTPSSKPRKRLMTDHAIPFQNDIPLTTLRKLLTPSQNDVSNLPPSDVSTTHQPPSQCTPVTSWSTSQLQSTPHRASSKFNDLVMATESAALSESLLKQIDLNKKLHAERTRTCRLRKKLLKLMKRPEPLSDPTPAQDVITLKEILTRYLPQKVCSFVLTQVRVSKQRKHGFRWTREDLDFAWSLYSTSKNAYKLMQQTFQLPTVRTLQTMVKKVTARPDGSQTTVAESRNVNTLESSLQLAADKAVFDHIGIGSLKTKDGTTIGIGGQRNTSNETRAGDEPTQKAIETRVTQEVTGVESERELREGSGGVQEMNPFPSEHELRKGRAGARESNSLVESEETEIEIIRVRRVDLDSGGGAQEANGAESETAIEMREGSRVVQEARIVVCETREGSEGQQPRPGVKYEIEGAPSVELCELLLSAMENSNPH